MFAKCLLVALLGICSGSVLGNEPSDREQEQRERLAEAKDLLLNRKEAEPALAILERVLEHYAAAYPRGTTRWYVARSPSEGLAYLLSAAAQHDRGMSGPPKSRVLYASWADALYYKAYALIEQRKMAEAEKVLQEAIRLSPHNAMYLAELGHVHQIAKDWEAALLAFGASEDAVAFSPESARTSDAGRAKRGMAYSLIELERLDEAISSLEEALELHPGDALARASLEYVKGRKAATTREPATP